MRRRLLQLSIAAVAALAVAGAYGVARLRRYVDEDPGLCAQCHRASPEFAMWNKGTHRGVACQRCHHTTVEEGIAMFRAFLAGVNPAGAKPHAKVEVGACAACHLSHDPQWPQIAGSRGHKLHVVEKKIECVRCHATGVHGFQPALASCAECHGEHAVRPGGMQQLHCFACHDFLSSDPGLRPTRRDCLRCHRAQGVAAARFAEDAPMQFECGRCHKPHARTKAGELVACSACHRDVARAGLHARAAHADCSACHTAHLWRTPDKDCSRCHAHAGAHAKGAACSGCHSFAGASAPVPPAAQ